MLDLKTQRHAAWKRHLAIGVGAWVALGAITAMLDPRGAGVVSLLGGFGPWLAAGIGLAAVYLAARISYRRRGWIAGGLVGGLCLAIVGVLVAAVDWNAVMQVALTLGGVAGVVALLLNAPSRSANCDSSTETFSPPSPSIPDPYSKPAPSNVDSSQWYENEAWWD